MIRRRTIFGFFLLCMILLIAQPVSFFTGPEYVYHREVGSHMENAYEVNTPERMAEEIHKSINGMRKLGLTENMYGGFFYWEQTPDRQMDWQYTFLDSVIDRVWAVAKWRNNTYGENATGVETLGDVYEAKMDNLREFLKEEGRADWIAHDAYYVNFHPFYWFRLPYFLLLIPLTLVLLILTLAGNIYCKDCGRMIWPTPGPFGSYFEKRDNHRLKYHAPERLR